MKNIGGQAVIEGVMMKSPKAWTVAVRGPDNQIFLKKNIVLDMPQFFKKPVVRGFVTLMQSLFIGIKALLFSAEKAGGEEEKPSPLSLGITIVISIALGLGIFLFLPLYSTKLLGLTFNSVSENQLLFNLVDGIIRIIFFLVYILLINTSRDIRRIFQYHGAEHKVVHAYEAGRELIPENVSDYSVLHPRCGTSFLLIVMILSILMFSLIPKGWPFAGKFLSRIVLVPFIAGCAYEFIKFSSREIHMPFMKIMIAPGLWLQRLTTREPSHDQIEVAIKALREVLNMESEVI